MKANEVNDFMKKQKEVRKLAMNEIQDAAKKYQITIDRLQIQLETNLHYCDNSQQANELMKEYHRKIRECTDAHKIGRAHV